MMKKRLLSAVMASAMVLSLAACGGAKTETTAAETTAEKKEETTTAGTTAAETAEAAGGTLIVGFQGLFILFVLTAAVLVFLTAAAWARVVSAGFFLCTFRCVSERTVTACIKRFSDLLTFNLNSRHS